MGSYVCPLCAFWILFLSGLGNHLSAGPVVHVGRVTPVEKRVEIDHIDHSTWNELLKKYVDDQGYVDYLAWKSNAQDSQRLDAYLDHLSAAKTQGSKHHQALLAFWINAYNAVTVKGILREYPTTSIRNHTARLLGYNIWKDLKLYVGDDEYSLDAMEHEILRKMDEPRIHFAIVCASIGCPRLLNEAYTAEQLDKQLATNAIHFFSDDAKCVVDEASGTLKLSPLLEWYGKDFGDDVKSQMNAVKQYLPENARKLVEAGRFRVVYLDYDWGLNERKGSH